MTAAGAAATAAAGAASSVRDMDGAVGGENTEGDIASRLSAADPVAFLVLVVGTGVGAAAALDGAAALGLKKLASIMAALAPARWQRQRSVVRFV